MDLVNDVLDFSKLDAGKVVLERRPLHLSALVREIEAFFAPEAFVKGIELVSTCSPDVPELILGDSTRIRQIVANLVANAIKFTATGGVHIHLGLDGEAPGDATPAIAACGCGSRSPTPASASTRRGCRSCSSPSTRPTRASAAASAAPASACRSPTTWRG